MKPSHISSTAFLRAAELQFLYRLGDGPYCYPYSCVNLMQALKEETGAVFFNENSEEMLFYKKHFKPSHILPNGIWWSLLKDGSVDSESRILALLLCHEMLKSS